MSLPIFPKELINEIFDILRKSALKNYLRVKLVDRHYFNLPDLFKNLEKFYITGVNDKQFDRYVPYPLWELLRHTPSCYNTRIYFRLTGPLRDKSIRNNEIHNVDIYMFVSSEAYQELKKVYHNINETQRYYYGNDDNPRLSVNEIHHHIHIMFTVSDVPKLLGKIDEHHIGMIYSS